MDVPKSIALRVARVTPKTSWAFVSLQTRDGLSGCGEATLNGREAALVAAAEVIVPHARSVSLARPGEFADAMAPRTLPEAAIVSAIDHALWDVHAQAGGVRLADALGGVRSEQIPVYANFNRRTLDRSPEGFAAGARDAQNAGFHAFKVAPFDEVDGEACARGGGVEAMQTGLERVRAVRAIVGRGARLMVDCHWRFDEPTAAALIAAAAGLGVHWVECPLPERLDNVAALVRLRRLANDHGLRLAGLEEGIGIDAFAPYVEAGAYDVVMPDVKYFGGLQHLLRASEWFASRGVEVSPHNPSGPICHAVSVHASAVIAGLDCLEMQFDESPLFESLVADGLHRPDSGFASLPRCSGLGVGLDVSLLASHTEIAPRTWNLA